MKQRDLLFIAVSSFLLVLFWVFFSVYNSFVTSTISDTLSTQIAPINPTFDTTTIDKLKTRSHVDPLFEASPAASLTGTATPPATSSPGGSVSGSSPSASEQPVTASAGATQAKQ